MGLWLIFVDLLLWMFHPDGAVDFLFLITYFLFTISFSIFFVIEMKLKEHKVYLLLGSNLNDPKLQLKLAQKKIVQKIGKIIRSSSYYQTAAWGNTQQPDFLNKVIVLTTQLDPFACLNLILSIEKEMGRVRLKKYEARVIDIDILFYEKEIIHSPQLIIPHPYIQERKFVLTPLNEIAPNFKHPKLHLNIHQLLKGCKDPLAVKKIMT
jgi:2-amino-4-hydroxy-6-hydroxymethyldihydropteridine diphosphokinase